MKTWKEEKARDTEYSGVIPLLPYLEYQYKERYVKLCDRCGVEPLSFGRWLCKSVDWLT